jgi:hypothetical protein
MQSTRAADALARASAALVGEHDVAGFLASLLNSFADVLDVDAAGILVEERGRLELLAASSHAAAELELHQALQDEGPCVDAHADDVAVSLADPDLQERWPDFGRTLVDAGFHYAHASPLHWHGAAIGAMGAFRRTGTPFTDEENVVAQAFADLATLLIVQTEQVDLTALRRRVDELLSTRVVIEQAKGVLSEQEGVDMAEAYAELLRRSAAEGTLLATAQEVVEAAQRQKR